MSIETILTFVVGFLTAALFGLLLLGAVARRARRLERTRLERMRPSSLLAMEAEVAAARAKGAVEIRALERALEASRHEEGVARLAADRITSSLRQRERELAKARDTIEDLENELASTQTRLSISEDSLKRARADLIENDRRLGAARAEADERALDLSRLTRDRNDIAGRLSLVETELKAHRASMAQPEDADENMTGAEDPALGALRSMIEAYRLENERLQNALTDAQGNMATAPATPEDRAQLVGAINELAIAITANAISNADDAGDLTAMIETSEGTGPLLEGLKATLDHDPSERTGKSTKTPSRRAKPGRKAADDKPTKLQKTRARLPKANSDDLKLS